MGCKEAIETINTALEVFPDPFRNTAQTIIELCAYAATGDVLLIQELLHVIGEKYDDVTSTSTVFSSSSKSDSFTSKSRDSNKSKPEWDFSTPQAVACLAVAVISLGDDVGMEMMQRILGNIWRYGDTGKQFKLETC